MPLTMQYDEWMKLTHSVIKPRSESLKKIDLAIQKRNEADAKKFLIAWIDEQNNKKQDWHRSVRNEKGAVKKLWDQLGVMGSAKVLSQNDKLADSAAKSEMRAEIRKAAAQMFTGKKIIFKNIFIQKIQDIAKKENTKVTASKFKIASDAKQIVDSAKGVYDIGNELKDAIKIILNGIPESEHSKIIEVALGSGAADFIASAAPAIGIATSGIKAGISIVNVIMSSLDLKEMESTKADIRMGDPSAALTAIMSIIENEIAKQKKDAAIHTTAFVSKSIAAGAGGAAGAAVGIALGAVESIAILLNNLNEFAKQYKQLNAGNELIKAGKIDLTIFKTCPVLGCYFIVVQDHSTIINFDVANMGRENWMQEAQRLTRAIKPVIKKAGELIDNSSIVMEGMENYKGVYQNTLFEKIKRKVKSPFQDHVKVEGQAGAFLKDELPVVQLLGD